MPAKSCLTLLCLVPLLAAGPAPAQQAIESADVRVSQPGSPTQSAPARDEAVQADWKGVRPGHTTRAQVESLLGKPASTMRGADGSLQYVYPPGAHLAFNRVVFGPSGIVSTVGIGLFDDRDRMRLSDLSSKYGAPSRVSQNSLRDYHSDQGIFLFPRPAGLWVVADESADEVVGATFYDPAREPDIPVPASPPLK